MYLSRLRIKNYRSIKELDLCFEKGKNIIVGKNNAGKSNIIKAIDIILGEGSPVYYKSENITENDFHGGNTGDNIFIFCELTKESNETINYEDIYKCLGFKYHAESKIWNKELGRYVGNPLRHNIRRDLADFWTDVDGIMNISEDEVETIYVNPKLKNQQTFEEQFNDKCLFAFSFRASFISSNKINKEIRFFYKETVSSDWILAFSAPIRTELLQSAIIPSFRDPSNELRINQWTWFGKLLRRSIDADNPNLKLAFSSLKEASDGVFENLKTEINNSRIKVAFPDTVVSFQFNPDTKIDVYKRALIYVDDGFNSLLQDKGSGIQSAVIIGLFHYYTRNIAHSSSSLLSIEEPEVYLHPQARRVISSRLNDFLEGNKNQVILTTHSSEFITTAHEDLNIILVRKDLSKGTVANNTSFKNSKEKQVLVKVQNAEMLFADTVILVEGGDKYIVESIAKYYGTKVKPELGENWLNEKNYSVIAVGGKTEFWKYYKKLRELKIPVLIIADFDFLLRKLSEFLTNIKVNKKHVDELNALKSKLGFQDISLRKKIVNEIDNFKKFLLKEGYSLDERELKNRLKEPFKIKKLEQIKSECRPDIRVYLESLKSRGIYILENELEDYYKEKCKKLISNISGKEEKPIYITSQLITPSQSITDFIECGEYIDFFNRLTDSKAL